MARARPYNRENYIFEVTQRAETLSKYFSMKFSKNFEGLAEKQRLPKRFIQFCKEAWEILEELYPGRGDIHFTLQPLFKEYQNTYGSNHINQFAVFDKFQITEIHLVIHWPEITITNSKKHEVTLRNLFTRIPVQISNHSTRGTLSFNVIQGVRTSVTPIEFQKGYSHSHLPSHNWNKSEQRCEWKNFCTGQGDINMVTATLNDNLDMDTLKLLLMQVQPFLEWESLEGRPYIRMINVINKDIGLPVVESTLCANILDQLKFSISRRKDLDLDWKLYNGKFIIVDNEKFEEMFRSHLNTYLTNNQIFMFKDEQGEYFTESTQRRDLYDQAPEFIPFRGQKIHFKVEGEFKKAGPSDTKYVHPKIKHYVKQQLELKANSTKIRNSVTGKQGGTAHTTGVRRQDKIPV